MPEATPDPLPALREVIAAHGLSAKRSLGQNFLLDLNLTRRIARAAGPLANTTLYEVGPGPGGLTRALLAEGAGRVIAVERDRRCLPALAEIASFHRGRLDIVESDALEIDEIALFEQHDVAGEIRVAANLPYNLATALLVKWLSPKCWPPFWQSLTLMFQREVAERLVGTPGSANYGRLSVFAQWRSQIRILFDVDRRAFTPAPKVTSSLVRFEPLAAPVAEARIEDLEAVTAAAFGQRRKMLRQSLKRLRVAPEALLSAAGIDPTARAQQLTLADFATLARSYRAMVESAKPSCDSRPR